MSLKLSEELNLSFAQVDFLFLPIKWQERAVFSDFSESQIFFPYPSSTISMVVLIISYGPRFENKNHLAPEAVDVTASEYSIFVIYL